MSPAMALGYLFPMRSMAFGYCLGLKQRQNGEEDVSSSAMSITSIAVVSYNRHAMISSKDVTGFIVLIKFGQEIFSLPNDIIDHLNIAHIFLGMTYPSVENGV